MDPPLATILVRPHGRRFFVPLVVIAALAAGVLAVRTVFSLATSPKLGENIASLFAPAAPLWDYDHTIRQSPGLDPENRIDVCAPFIVADSGWVYTEGQGFTARIYGTTDYLCVLVPSPKFKPWRPDLLGDKVAYIGLAAPIVGSTQNAWIPSAGTVDVRYMLTREQFEEFKRDGISPERLQRLRDEAARDGWRPPRMGMPANTTVRTIPW